MITRDEQIKLITEINEKFNQIVNLEQGIINRDDVFKVEFNENEKIKNRYLSIDTFMQSVEELVLRVYPNSTVCYTNAENILIHYRLPKVY